LRLGATTTAAIMEEARRRGIADTPAEFAVVVIETGVGY
jgi:hypothetical protein